MMGLMRENQLKDIIGKGLPKIAATAIAIYPVGFLTQLEASRDHLLDVQIACSQLVYTRKTQILSFLILEPSQIGKLGQRAFPKYGRSDAPKMVLSANCEVLNSIMSKIGYLVGKVDEEADPNVTPPKIINCAGSDSLPIRGEESLFLRFAAADVSMLLILSIQAI